MNENSGAPDPEQGLYRKYDVTRLNDPAGKHKDCTYYILDLDHDPHSVAALLAYAKSCEAQYPTLAFDLRHTAAATARKLNVATMPTEELSLPLALDKIEASLEAASEERYKELKLWEAEAWKWKSEGDGYGWNFHTGMAAGANWCDIFYRRIGRTITEIRKTIVSPLAYTEPK